MDRRSSALNIECQRPLALSSTPHSCLSMPVCHLCRSFLTNLCVISTQVCLLSYHKTIKRSQKNNVFIFWTTSWSLSQPETLPVMSLTISLVFHCGSGQSHRSLKGPRLSVFVCLMHCMILLNYTTTHLAITCPVKSWNHLI